MQNPKNAVQSAGKRNISMPLAFHFGRTADLASQELLAVASVLPFPWTTSKLSSELLMLKPTGDGFPELEQAQAVVLPLQERLGGTMRIIWIDGQVARDELIEALAELAFQTRESVVPGARSVGLSVWGDIDVHRFGIKLKRVLKEDWDWSARMVLPKQGSLLTPAQVSGERLAGVPRGSAQKGVELMAIQQGTNWLIGVTLTTSNIDFYSHRDFGIPVPDPVSGMLPPKLAQMMVNLAVGGQNLHVHDPFCGNGRVVLEAALMGLPASGSDIAPQKVAAAQQNLLWMAEQGGFKATPEQIWEGNAASIDNRERIIANAAPDYVLVGEPYLGRPLREALPKGEQAAWLTELFPIYEKYFECWAEVSVQPRCHLLIMPRAKVADGTEVAVSAAIVDRLHQVGYSAEVLYCYDRPDSIVRRDIVRLRRSAH